MPRHVDKDGKITVTRFNAETFKQAIAGELGPRVPDGNSLFLHVRGRSALWMYQYRDGQSMRTRSLGSAADMSPAAARKAREDFAAERRGARVPRRGLAVINSALPPVDPSASVTGKRMRFADAVDSCITWKSSGSDWKVTSREPDAYRLLKDGKLGKMWTDEIGHTDVADELKSRWGNALANAEKMRGRIETVMAHAAANGARLPDSANPARKEIIEKLIAAPPETKHRPGMKRQDVPAFMAELVADGSPSARALAFLILTVSRNVEARQADWSEIKGNAWIIPGGRGERSMKEGDAHVIPLSKQALELLGERKPSGLIFGAMHHNALLDKLRALRPDYVNDNGDRIVVHGFRTSFTSWARANKYPKDLYNEAKAHKVDNDSDKAYEGGFEHDDKLKERRPMLKAWSDFAMGLVKPQ